MKFIAYILALSALCFAVTPDPMPPYQAPWGRGFLTAADTSVVGCTNAGYTGSGVCVRQTGGTLISPVFTGTVTGAASNWSGLLTAAGNVGMGTITPGVLAGGLDLSTYGVVQRNGANGRAYSILSATDFTTSMWENSNGTAGRNVFQTTFNSGAVTSYFVSGVNGAVYSTSLILHDDGRVTIGGLLTGAASTWSSTLTATASVAITAATASGAGVVRVGSNASGYRSEQQIINFGGAAGGEYGWSLGRRTDDNLSLYNNLLDATALTVNAATNAITVAGSIQTGAPNTGTAAPWKLGIIVTAGCVLDATTYAQVDISGTFRKVALCQ